MYTERTTDCSKFLASTGAISPGFHSVIKYNFAQMHYAKDNVLGAVYYRNRDWKYNTSTHQKGNNYGFNLQNRWDMEDTKLTAGVEYERNLEESFVRSFRSCGLRQNGIPIMSILTVLCVHLMYTNSGVLQHNL